MGGADGLARKCRGMPVDSPLRLSGKFPSAPHNQWRALHVVGDGTRGAASAARSCSIWVSTGLGGKLSLPGASRDL
jgi:hypothetical protein